MARSSVIPAIEARLEQWLDQWASEPLDQLLPDFFEPTTLGERPPGRRLSCTAC